MDPTYSIVIDVPRSLVLLTIGGFFDAGDIAAFNAVRRFEYQRLRCPPNQHVALVDIRDMSIQSQEAVGLFAQMLAEPSTRARRVAFVVARSLARLQVRRAASGRDAAFFATHEEAERWLLADDARAA